MNSPLKIAYILLHFPYLTETFVAEEIRSVRDQNVDVQIISLLEAGKGPTQPLSQMLLPFVWYAPTFHAINLWLAQFFFLFNKPAIYFKLLIRLLSCSYPAERQGTIFAKRLAVFLKAVASAYYLRKSNVGLLHAHFAWLPGAAAWIIARLLNIPFTVTIHAYDIYASNDLLSLVIQEADHVVSISDYNRQHVARLGHRAPSQISVIHCGVDVDTFDSSSTFLIEQQSGERPLQILSVGSLNEKKGHKFLIEACKLLKEDGVQFVCNIIGEGGDRDFLEQQIKDLDLTNHVQLLGAKPSPEVKKAYCQHDLFVLASVIAANGDRDGIPVVMMEAAAAGLPLISTFVSGIPELVREGENGFLVSPKDPEALSKAIQHLAQDPVCRAEFGARGKQLVASEFNISTNALQLVRLFQKLCH